MKSFTAEGQSNCSPKEQNGYRKWSSTVDAVTGSPEPRHENSASIAEAIVQTKSSTMNRVPDPPGLWTTSPASSSRSSSSSSDNEAHEGEAGKIAIEGESSTGVRKNRATDVSNHYHLKMGETSVRLLPSGTGSAKDRGENAQKRCSLGRMRDANVVGGMRRVATTTVNTLTSPPCCAYIPKLTKPLHVSGF